MPALKKIRKSDLFVGLAQEAAAKGERMDCAVKAICVVTGLPYSTVHAAVAAAGRKDARRTHDQVWKAALEALGFTTRLWTHTEMYELRQSYPKKGILNITTHHPRRFPKAWAAHRGPLLLRSNGHISGYVNGEVHDWAVNSSKQVFAIWEVIKK